MDNIKKSNLLILRGVYPRDFDNIDWNYSKENSETSYDIYTELPKKFIDVASWPQTSNLKCWECDQLPVSFPKFIPKEPEKDAEGRDICEVYGHFDEWPCAVRFINREFPREQQWDALYNILLFESKFSGKMKEKILPAPPKYLMKAYCGKNGITAKQYRDKIIEQSTNYVLNTYKMEHYKHDD